MLVLVSICVWTVLVDVQIPRTCQCMLMSATTSEDVQRLQKLVLHNPTVIDCTEHGPGANDLATTNAAGTSSSIQHYSIQCSRLVTFANLSCAAIYMVHGPVVVEMS